MTDLNEISIAVYCHNVYSDNSCDLLSIERMSYVDAISFKTYLLNHGYSFCDDNGPIRYRQLQSRFSPILGHRSYYIEYSFCMI